MIWDNNSIFRTNCAIICGTRAYMLRGFLRMSRGGNGVRNSRNFFVLLAHNSKRLRLLEFCLRRKYCSKIPTDMKVLICGPKALNISGISDTLSPRYIRKNPRSMYARVPHRMAQFVLKIEILSHIIGTAPILEMARAYGLRPRLWLLMETTSSDRKSVV